MKTKNLFFALLLSVFSMGFFCACSNDDEGPLSDPATVISGTYVGTGALTDTYGLNIEYDDYAGMKMVITKSSNEFVLVTPYEADGSPFFASGSGHVFQITQSASGDFMLTSTDYPQCRVTVTASRAMNYYFPYVSVEGESGYALSFSGSKQ